MSEPPWLAPGGTGAAPAHEGAWNVQRRLVADRDGGGHLDTGVSPRAGAGRIEGATRLAARRNRVT